MKYSESFTLLNTNISSDDFKKEAPDFPPSDAQISHDDIDRIKCKIEILFEILKASNSSG